MAEKKKQSLWLDSTVSSRLFTKREELAEYNQALKDLKVKAEELAPGGRLVVHVVTESEKFGEIEKAVANVASMKKYYNENSIMQNPEIALELSKISEHINAVNKIIEKRRKKTTAAYKARQNHKKAPAEKSE